MSERRVVDGQRSETRSSVMGVVGLRVSVGLCMSEKDGGRKAILSERDQNHRHFVPLAVLTSPGIPIGTVARSCFTFRAMRISRHALGLKYTASRVSAFFFLPSNLLGMASAPCRHHPSWWWAPRPPKEAPAGLTDKKKVTAKSRRLHQLPARSLWKHKKFFLKA